VAQASTVRLEPYFLHFNLLILDFIQVTTYTRAAASDYDDWEQIYGNKGWGSKHLIPLLKKVREHHICFDFA
jgi:hypothetical protein